MLILKKIGNGGYRVTMKNGKTSMLTRYGILNDELRRDYSNCEAETIEEGVLLRGTKRDVNFSVDNFKDGGFQIRIPLTKEERLFGLGDANRDSVMIRGKTLNIWIANVASYGPMPVLVSSDGWAIIVNSTYYQKFDIADSDKDRVIISVAGGASDFYILSANSILDLVQAITDVTGKPIMLPAFGYGLTFVETERNINARKVLDDIRMMRDRDIPCDVFGLEPAWMENYYDMSTEKSWNKENFWLPTWLPENTASHRSFLGPMRFMGMQLSLWLCEDYDLFYEEDRQAKETTCESENAQVGDIDDAAFRKNVEFVDANIQGVVNTDQITKEDEPWFEHLKKFVDNGAACFKLDGCAQVVPHPQRLWAKKYFDSEAHNAYPVVLAKQMKNGFSEYTDRRSLIYTAGAHLGTQQYAATWAGDTGGGPRTLVACLNYAMCGHTNTTCDMDIMDVKAIHYAFLSTWTQISSWAYYFHPWFLPPEVEKTIQRYSKLRSSLFPYIYAMAHKASVTGIPVMRPLPMMYENTDRYDDVHNAYMLGDSLYVGAFDMNLKLPEGEWVDYFTGKVYAGDISYETANGYAGALFVKKGSILATMQPQQYILEKEHDYIVRVYSGADAAFELYEDDAFTYDYEKGGYAETRFEWKEESATLAVYRRKGDFEGRPNNGYDLLNSSVPKIDGIRSVRDMQIRIYGKLPKSISLNGSAVEFTDCDGYVEFTLPASLHEKGDLFYQIKY
ncbi:MAG: glycoside hydrolase family 31 protein [Clostridia bacterium]|nr:glycoside hydrolase family 31 protein [Clostridia bacterium]